MEQTNLLVEARAEEKRLLTALADLDNEHQRKRGPVLRKLEACRSVKAAFATSEPELDLAHPRLTAEALAANTGADALRTAENSHKGRVISACLILLADDVHMRTPVLLEKLEAQGIEFRAANKAGNLSVILSKDPRFVSDRRTGWSLAQKNPQDAATSAGSLPT